MKWIQEHPRTCKLIFFILLFLAGWFWLRQCSGVMETTVIEPSKPLPLPKIEEVKKPYVKPEVKPNIPVKKKKVYKQKEKDLRDSIIKGKIVIGIELVNGAIQLTTVDSNDLVSKEEMPVDIKLPDGVDTIKVNEKGAELVPEKEKTKVGKVFQDIGKGTKKFVKGAGKGLAVIGGAAVVGAVIVAGAPVAVVAVVGGVTVIVVVAVLASGG